MFSFGMYIIGNIRIDLILCKLIILEYKNVYIYELQVTNEHFKENKRMFEENKAKVSILNINITL